MVGTFSLNSCPFFSSTTTAILDLRYAVRPPEPERFRQEEDARLDAAQHRRHRRLRRVRGGGRGGGGGTRPRGASGEEGRRQSGQRR